MRKMPWNWEAAPVFHGPSREREEINALIKRTTPHFYKIGNLQGVDQWTLMGTGLTLGQIAMLSIRSKGKTKAK